MLAECAVTATIPARDMERAKRFYRDTLGLKVERESVEGIHYESGGTRLFLYPTVSTETAGHTLACWTVTDLDAEMRDLRARGITFEEYDLPGLRTVNGVAETSDGRGAWFKDSEGNILALEEMRI